MPSSLTPGSSSSHVSSCAMPTRPSPRSERLGTPKTPAIRFTRGSSFEASLVRICYGLSGCSPPWTDRTKFPWPTGDFYIQASGGSVALSAAGYDYNSTGLLCWRDFHPQEWQLASLHPILRASPKGQVRRASLNRFDPDLARDRRDHGSEEGGHSCGTAMYLPLHLHPACLLHLEQSRADGRTLLAVYPEVPDDLGRRDPWLAPDDLVELLLAAAWMRCSAS